MRGKKATLNTALNLLEQLASVICAFILPRLILSVFGSRYNGLTASITQFLSCAVLLRSGIGGATRSALYKPIAEGNQEEINSIVKATDIFMKKIGLILAGAIAVFAALYPVFVKNDFGWFFTFSLFLIIGASTFAESFFGITYLIVLQADQRLWITSVLKIICYVLNTIFGAVLILNGFSIHIVKLVSSIVFVAYPVLLGIYVRKNYHIDTNVSPNNQAISQRWDAFWQQVAIFVTTNTDVMVLTIFANILEVSVYTVYNMIFEGLKRVLAAFSNGLEAALGNMIAKKEEDALRENVAILETILYGLSTILYTCASLLVVSFVGIYTKGITDINYLRPGFVYVMVVAHFFNGIRIPYQLTVQAAGHYKQTKKGAIIEPIINLVTSIVLVTKIGLIGVAIGTLIATVFRTVQYSVYMSRHIVKRSIMIVILRIIVSFIEAAVIIVIVGVLGLATPVSYMTWFFNAMIIGIICVIVVSTGTYLFFMKDTKRMIKKVMGILKR